MEKLNHIKLFQALLLTTTLLSGSSIFAMEGKEDKDPSHIPPQTSKPSATQAPITQADLDSALPILAEKISNLSSFFQEMSPEESHRTIQRIQPFQENLENIYYVNEEHNLVEFIKNVKDLTDEQWSPIYKNILIFHKKEKDPERKNLFGYELNKFIKEIKALPSQQLSIAYERLLPFQNRFKHGYQLKEVLENMVDVTNEQWALIQKRMHPFQEKMVNGYDLSCFIRKVKNLTEEQWTNVQNRIPAFQGLLNDGDDLGVFIGIVGKLAEEKWNTTKKRVMPYIEKYESDDWLYFIKEVNKLTEEQWTVVEKRFIPYIENPEYKLFDWSLFVKIAKDLNDEEWAITEKRILSIREKLNHDGHLFYIIWKLKPYLTTPHWVTTEKRFLPFLKEFAHSLQLVDFVKILHDLTEEQWTKVALPLQQLPLVELGTLLNLDKVFRVHEEFSRFIEVAKNLTQEQWAECIMPLLDKLSKDCSPVKFINSLQLNPEESTIAQNRILPLIKEIQDGVQLKSLIESVKILTEEEWTSIQQRILLFKEYLQEESQLAYFINTVKNMTDSQWTFILPFRKEIQNEHELYTFIDAMKNLPEETRAIVQQRILPFKEKLQDGSQLAYFINTVKNMTDSQWAFILPFRKETQNEHELYTFIDAMKNLPEETRTIVQQRILPFKEKLQDGSQLVSFIYLVKNLTERQWIWMSSFQENLKNKDLLDFIQLHTMETAHFLNNLGEQDWMLVQKRILPCLRQLSSGYLLIFYLKDLIETVKDLTEEDWVITQKRIQPFQEKVHKGYNFVNFIQEVKRLNEQEWITVQNRIFPFLEKLKQGSGLVHFIEPAKDLKEEEWVILRKRIELFLELGSDSEPFIQMFIEAVKDLTEERWIHRILPLQEKLKNSSDLVFDLVRFINLVKDLTDEQWKHILPFQEEFKGEYAFIDFIKNVKDLTDEQWKHILPFQEEFKDVDAFIDFIKNVKDLTDEQWKRILPLREKLRKISDLLDFINSVKDLTDEQWNLIAPFADILTPANVKDIFNSLNPRYQFIKALSLFMLNNHHSERIKTWLQDEILDEKKDPQIVVIGMAGGLGEEHPLTQEFIQLALGRTNQNNPDGFLAIHQEVLKKAHDQVEHSPRVMETKEGQLTLNTTLIKEPRPTGDIPMIQVALWEKLMDQYEKFAQTSIDALKTLSSDVDPSHLFALKSNVFLRALLDANVMRTGTHIPAQSSVSTTSYEFRKVIEQIFLLENENLTAAMLLLHQLLVNIQTCPTGKEDGISHSYRLLKNEKILEEDQLGTERFKTEIVTFFKEELRRMREATLPNILGHLHLSEGNPHYIHYLRGILGGEVGLFFKDEKPAIDVNSNNLSYKLRKMSKQDLLQIFYLYHKPEDIINRVHTMLNNGSISIANKKDVILTTAILNMYFSDKEKFDPRYTVFDQDENPIGLTPLAAQKLLQELGFLIPPLEDL